MARAPSSERRRRPIAEWPRRELWLCATLLPAATVTFLVVTLAGDGHYYGEWDRWLMGALLTFQVACPYRARPVAVPRPGLA
jgi:hypothetical protein